MKAAFAVVITLSLALAGVGVYFSLQGLLWLYIVLLFVSFAVMSPLHELGHKLFGALAGIRTKLHLAFIKPSGCEMIPKRADGLKGRVIFTALGGIAVNALFMVLGVLALCIEALPTELSAFLPFSFYLAAINALPFNYADGRTDGCVIYELIKNTDAAEVMLAVLTVQAKLLGGTPYGEIERSLLFDLPQLPEDDRAFISLTQLRRDYCLATGDEEGAKKYADRYEQLKEEYLGQSEK